MFGPPGNTSFGFNTTQGSPFGQSAFGKTNAPSTGFGTNTPPVFGANTSLFTSKPTGTATGGLFGNTTSTPTFGANTATQSTFGGFGNANTSNTLFGAQQNTSSNMFGTTNTASTFGQANKPGGFGFGQTTGTNLFGQTQQAGQSTLFGQPTATANTGLFGSTSAFGATNTAGGVSGTAIKFNPVTGTDTMVKNGVTQTISTRHHCITCMKEYEGKSLEELRLEDYLAGRKGAQGQPQTMFGAAATGAQSTPFGAVSNTSTPGFGTMTSGFNTSQAGTSGLFSKPLAGFGAPAATTSSAFSFNATTSSNLFNTQSKPFGATAPTPLFSGNTTNPTQTGAFGTLNTQNTGFGTSFNAGQANQSIGLFSQNKPAFSLPASTSTSTFGFGQPSTATSLFGTKPAATGFGATGFGTTTSTFPAANTGFGANANTNTSLFNNSFKTTNQSGGFTFGNTSNAISTNLGTGGSTLFSTAAKPNMFSSGGLTTNFNTTGGFGNLSGFGTNSNTVPLSSNLFGQGTAPNNFQQNTGSVPVHQQILALVSAPFGNSPLLKNLLPASGKSEQFVKPSNNFKGVNSPQQHKVLTGNSVSKLKPKVVAAVPLSKKSLFDGLEEEDPLMEAFQPRPNAKRLVLRPKMNTPNEVNEEVTRTDKNNQDASENVTSIEEKENEIKGIERTGNDRRSSTSWLKSSLPKQLKNLDDQHSNPSTEFPLVSESPQEGEEINNTIAELRSPLTTKSPDSSALQREISSTVDNSINKSDESSNLYLEQSETSVHLTDVPMNKANVKLHRSGYFTIPSLEDLNKYVVDKTCIVPDFTVGRKRYGNVYFADSIDVYGLNLDEIVHFRYKEVIIYPDDNVKPPIGQELNRKAQVTLDGVWPIDKSTHEPITDPNRLIEMNYELKLRRVCAKHGTRFLEYRPETGSWVFKVDHFSKYGLSDSDDEETIAINAQDPANTLPGQKDLKNLPLQKDLQRDYKSLKGEKEMPPYIHSRLPVMDNIEELAYDLQMQQAKKSDHTFSPHPVYSPTAINAQLVGTESHTLQLMKASFFDSSEDHYMHDLSDQCKSWLAKKKETLIASQIRSPKPTDFMVEPQESLIEHFLLQPTRTIADDIAFSKKEKILSVKTKKPEEKAMPEPVFRPETVNLKFKHGIPHFPLTGGKSIHKYFTDLGIFQGRQCKLSWGPQMTLLSYQYDSTALFHENQREDTGLRYVSNPLFTNFLQFTQVTGENVDSKVFEASIEGHLHIQLQYSKIEDHEICPYITMLTESSSIAALHAHETESSKNVTDYQNDASVKYSNIVWSLCKSIWGQLIGSRSDLNDTDHEMIMLRRNALSDWLKFVVAETIQNKISCIGNHEEIIFQLLSGNKLEEACDKALKAGDHCLALLLSQVGGAANVQELVKKQIKLWQDTDADQIIAIERLKLYMLVAGVPVISTKEETINCCENLDWKRALAVHLWYLSNPTASVPDILDFYESSFTDSENTYSASPYPEYLETDFDSEINGHKSIYDVCYHLLKLYCSGNYPLESLLNPLTYTHDPMDYRLSWLLHQVLNSLGYSHLSEHISELINTNFGAQLETFDLWHWAVFVALHLKDPMKRKAAIVDLLFRHVQIDENPEYLKKEKFLKEKLKVPAEWIHQAKATKAFCTKKYEKAAWHYISGFEWNKAHEVIMDHIATDAIINEDVEYLTKLLTMIMDANGSSSISGWSYQGQLVWDYLTVIRELRNLCDEENKDDIAYKLELLQPQVTSLCTKINLFPCPTVKHILCQAEMAKRTLQLARSLLLLQPDQESNNEFLLQLISDLPLPEDYAQQELRMIIQSY